MDLTGKQLGPYQINSPIGQGGMAAIYRAVDTRNGEIIALKVMLPHLAYESETRQRFHEEGENAQRLIHPNIVRVYETGQIDGHAYIAMEYAAGGTVAQLLKTRRHPMSAQEALPILYRVAAALDYAHHRGILHRDIKPSNILLGRNNQILLSDFGIARRLGGEFTVVTTTGATVGTPAYMSPEQALGEERIDHRADIYSLGVVAYVMLTHTMPFDADTPLALLRKVIDVAPAPPEEVNAQMPPGVSYVLQRALAKNPAQRYASAGEFVAALEAGINRTPTAAEWAAVRQPRVEALPTPLVAPPPVLGDRPKAAAPNVPPPQPRHGRRGWLLLVGGALMILLLVVALQTLSSGGVTLFSANQLTPARSTAAGVAVQAPATQTTTAIRSSIDKPMVAAAVLETATKAPTRSALVTPTRLPTQGNTIDQVAALATVDRVVENATKILKDSLIGVTTQEQATLVATPTKTKVKRPTSTPIADPPTATPTLIPSKTPTQQPTRSPTQPATATPGTVANSDSSSSVSDLPTTVTLLAPNEGDTLDGKLTFNWVTNTTLPEGYQFEPVFWRAGEEAMRDGRGYGGTTTNTSLAISAEIFRSTGEGEYYWGILLVKTDPYQRIGYLGGNRLIRVKAATSGTNSSNGAKSPCNSDKESC